MTHAERAERRERIAEAVRNGADPWQVCRDESVSWTTVYDACRAGGRLGKRVRKPLPPLPPLTREFNAVTVKRTCDIIALLQQGGKSLRAIGLVVGVRCQWVSQIETMALEAGLLAPRGAKASG